MTNLEPVKRYLECGKAFKSKLAKRERLIGTFIKSTDPAIIEIASQAGLDFLIFDTEHRAMPASALSGAVQIARSYQIPLLVRVADHAPATINRVLDEGALGILAPSVSSAEQARAISAATHYHGGTRGFSPSTAANGYGVLPLETYKAMADEAISVICQIETVDGLEAAPDIMSTSGIDGSFIGPVDLAHALKEQKSGTGPTLDDAIDQITAASKELAKPLGIFAASPDYLQKPQADGMSFFAIGTDFSLLKQSISSVVRQCEQVDNSNKQKYERRD